MEYRYRRFCGLPRYLLLPILRDFAYPHGTLSNGICTQIITELIKLSTLVCTSVLFSRHSICSQHRQCVESLFSIVSIYKQSQMTENGVFLLKTLDHCDIIIRNANSQTLWTSVYFSSATMHDLIYTLAA